MTVTWLPEVVLCAVAATVILPNLSVAAHQQSGMLANMSAAVHPQQLFQELKQHSRLLSRPRFLTALQNEQLTLAKQVGDGRSAHRHVANGVRGFAK
jgi:hypothetical protein